MSVHGANRLGANSLLDIVVFGRACANHIKENLTPGKPHKKIPDEAGLSSIEFLDKIRGADGPKSTASIRLDMQKAMQTDAAVFRSVMAPSCPCYMKLTYMRPVNSTQQSLDEGVEKLRNIYNSYEDVGIKDRSMIWNSYVSCRA